MLSSGKEYRLKEVPTVEVLIVSGKCGSHPVIGLSSFSNGVAEVFLSGVALAFLRWRPGKIPNNDPFYFFQKTPWLGQWPTEPLGHEVQYSNKEGYSKDGSVFFIRKSGTQRNLSVPVPIPGVRMDHFYVGSMSLPSLTVYLPTPMKGSQICSAILSKVSANDYARILDPDDVVVVDLRVGNVYDSTVKVVFRTGLGFPFVAERRKKLSHPGGRVKVGEEIVGAAIRELREELGWVCASDHFKLLGESVAYDHLITVLEYVGPVKRSSALIFATLEEAKGHDFGWVFPQLDLLNIVPGDFGGVHYNDWGVDSSFITPKVAVPMSTTPTGLLTVTGVTVLPGLMPSWYVMLSDEQKKRLRSCFHDQANILREAFIRMGSFNMFRDDFDSYIETSDYSKDFIILLQNSRKRIKDAAFSNYPLHRSSEEGCMLCGRFPSTSFFPVKKKRKPVKCLLCLGSPFC